MTDEPLSGGTAIVTGASVGIGRETARVLAHRGANVALAARREELLEELATESSRNTAPGRSWCRRT